ncbi:ABC transporter substrate-binding protein [Pseudomonas sp. ANT_H14]|uniref:molybdate ABC transporter substrate-binding protein n=1 Tax=unclassified Pseudomonas TaxID=196821 RepID=UPI0011EBB178|nr:MULTISPECIES: substrate-binding domain-containing protein [unclassified Pseudomonas]KAA0941911.1 ABC transporter substrate-binding protein [Pseudomonas sp. ANT_H4]KAA0947201.1 ABC transporter substrate-binding protein [Pseudomonas sp. ANT_H14]
MFSRVYRRSGRVKSSCCFRISGSRFNHARCDARTHTTKTISAKPVAEAVARGEAEIGFQQLSELMHIEGIDVIGLIPDQVQKMTMYSAAITTGSVQQEEAATLLKFLSSEAARSAMKLGGLTPVR